MQIKLDWLSFSFFQHENHHDNDREAIIAAYTYLTDELPGRAGLFFSDLRWEHDRGRKPYSCSIRTEDNGVAIFANAKLPHALVELSGKGIERLLRHDSANELISAVTDRVTRIDLACDIETDVDPREFAASREPGRFKSGSEFVSDSGITVYVGSKTSNRYARVYRYNAPHPRAHLLRVEHVFKGDDAKSMLAYIADKGYEHAAQQSQAMFGWKHSTWTIAPAAEREINAHRNEREASKTLFWLYDTVGPLLARLHNEGKLSIGTFLNEAVMPHIKPDDTEPLDTEPIAGV